MLVSHSAGNDLRLPQTLIARDKEWGNVCKSNSTVNDSVRTDRMYTLAAKYETIAGRRSMLHKRWKSVHAAMGLFNPQPSAQANSRVTYVPERATLVSEPNIYESRLINESYKNTDARIVNHLTFEGNPRYGHQQFRSGRTIPRSCRRSMSSSDRRIQSYSKVFGEREPDEQRSGRSRDRTRDREFRS